MHESQNRPFHVIVFTLFEFCFNVQPLKRKGSIQRCTSIIEPFKVAKGSMKKGCMATCAPELDLVCSKSSPAPLHHRLQVPPQHAWTSILIRYTSRHRYQHSLFSFPNLSSQPTILAANSRSWSQIWSARASTSVIHFKPAVSLKFSAKNCPGHPLR